MPIVTGGVALPITTTSIASAALLTLGTTPVTLVAAPGAGLVVVPVSVTGSLTFLTGAYTNAGTLSVGWNGANGVTVTNVNGALTAAASQVGVTGGLSLGTIARASVANLALTLQSSGAVAVGAGSFVVTVSYYIATV